MCRPPTALLLILAFAMLPQTGAGQVGLAAGIGTTGLGGEVAFGLGERVVLRVGAGLSTLDVSTTFDSVPMDIDLPREWYHGGLDFYLNSAFRVGAGVIVRPDDVGLVDRFGERAVEIGGETLTPAQIGTLTGVIDSQKRAPYLLIGFGKHVASGVGLSLDVGAAYFGSATTTLQASGGTYPQADLNALLLAESGDFDADMKTYMEVWPILRLALRVGLGDR